MTWLTAVLIVVGVVFVVVGGYLLTDADDERAPHRPLW